MIRTAQQNVSLPVVSDCNSWITQWSPAWDQDFTRRLAKYINEASLRHNLAVNKAALCIVLAEQKMDRCDANTLEWFMAFESHRHNTGKLQNLTGNAFPRFNSLCARTRGKMFHNNTSNDSSFY